MVLGAKCVKPGRQVEQVLETYFMNLDNTYHRLQILAEYVEDSEDYIKFDIDTQRNRFIEVAVSVVLVMSTLCARHACMASLVGQSKCSDLYTTQTYSISQFSYMQLLCIQA